MTSKQLFLTHKRGTAQTWVSSSYVRKQGSEEPPNGGGGAALAGEDGLESGERGLVHPHGVVGGEPVPTGRARVHL